MNTVHAVAPTSNTSVEFSKKATKQYSSLSRSVQHAVDRAIERLKQQKAKKLHRFYFDSEGACGVRVDKRTRLIIVSQRGGWYLREIVDRADNRYYKTE